MATVWFILLGFMLTMYVLLDGFDLGAGAIHLVAARDDAERRMILRAIGPVWDGNEVWLIATGGTLFFTFPLLYASSFSGFYLPLTIVLWLLMLRGLAIELRAHGDNPLWATFWDGLFFLGSALLAFFFGAALGNVVRGVPLDASGYFFAPLWTTFDPRSPVPGILDWYTVLIGLLALAALVLHGAHWIALKTEGALHDRCRRIARGDLARRFHEAPCRRICGRDRCSGNEVEIGGERLEVRRRYRHELCEAAVGVLTEDVVFGTHRLLPGEAVFAGPARKAAIDGDPISDPDSGNRAPHRRHFASDIPARDEGIVPFLPGENRLRRTCPCPDIHSIETTGANTHQRIARPDLRYRHDIDRDNLGTTSPMYDCCPHCTHLYTLLRYDGGECP